MTVDAVLRYSVLGPLTVDRGTERLELGHVRQRAVVALLLIHANTSLTSDQMIDLLWGDRAPRAAMATLQAYVSNLRRVIEPERAARTPASVLTSTNGGYQLVVEPDALDSARFGALIAEGSGLVASNPSRGRELLVDALGLWRAPAFADFRYEAFATFEIARLEELRGSALEMRVAADLALGRSTELVAELDALVHQYPMREQLRRHQMLALYRAGRQTDALASYRAFSHDLREELGLEPSSALRDLELAILEHDPHLLHVPHGSVESANVPVRSTTAGDGPTAPHLVGRESEHRRFTAALARAATGSGSILLFEGEAGIGKTRLLERLHHEARFHGMITAFARCVEVGGTPPFWPWTQLVRQLDPDHVETAAGAYAAHLGPLLPPRQDHVGDQPSPLFRVVEGLMAALQTFGEHSPVVLFLDDLYSSDPDSLSLLTLLGAELERLPVVIVGTHRGLELGPSHPLTIALEQLSRFDRVDHITLRRFDIGEVGEVVRDITGEAADASLVAAIHDRTGGNAFYTVELTKLLDAANKLDPLNALREVPKTVRAVIDQRIDRLAPDTVRLLRAGAIAGREFDMATLADVMSVAVDDAATGVDEALRSGLVRETDKPGTYRFTHIIVVDAVIDSLGSIRRAQLHGLLADVLERQDHDSSAAWTTIAHHRREAIPIAGPSGAIDALVRAGRHAITSDALELAGQLFEQRRSLVHDLPANAARDTHEVAALLDLTRVWTRSEGYHSLRITEVGPRLWELTGLREGSVNLDLSTPITADHPVLSALQARFSNEIVRGDISAAELVVEQFLDLAAAHPDPMVILGANQAATVVRVHAGRVDSAVLATEAAAEALDLLDPHGVGLVTLPLGQQSARVTHHCFAGWAYFLAGDRERAELELRTARRCCDRMRSAFTTGFCVAVEGLVAAMDDSPEWVADTVAWGRADLDGGVFGLMDVWHDLLSTWAHGMIDGDPEDAAERLRSTMQELRQQGALVVHSLYWAMTARLEGRAGRDEHVVDATSRGIEHADQFGERFWYPELERLAAQAFGDLGRSDEQRGAHRRAVAAARDLGIRPVLERLRAPSAH